MTLTRDKVFQLKGRDLDAEVHRCIFGANVVKAHEYMKDSDGQLHHVQSDWYDEKTKEPVPNYSSDMGAAWQILQRMRKLCFEDQDRWLAFRYALEELAGNPLHEEDFVEWMLMDMEPVDIVRAALLVECEN